VKVAEKKRCILLSSEPWICLGKRVEGKGVHSGGGKCYLTKWSERAELWGKKVKTALWRLLVSGVGKIRRTSTGSLKGEEELD